MLTRSGGGSVPRDRDRTQSEEYGSPGWVGGTRGTVPEHAHKEATTRSRYRYTAHAGGRAASCTPEHAHKEATTRHTATSANLPTRRRVQARVAPTATHTRNTRKQAGSGGGGSALSPLPGVPRPRRRGWQSFAAGDSLFRSAKTNGLLINSLMLTRSGGGSVPRDRDRTQSEEYGSPGSPARRVERAG